MCRKCQGAVFASFAVLPAGALEVTRGADALTTFESSPGVTRRFCAGCGCHLFCAVASKPHLEYYLPATLDAGCAPGHPPDRERHIFVGSRCPWLHPSILGRQEGGGGKLPCEDEEIDHGLY